MVGNNKQTLRIHAQRDEIRTHNNTKTFVTFELRHMTTSKALTFNCNFSLLVDRGRSNYWRFPTNSVNRISNIRCHYLH